MKINVLGVLVDNVSKQEAIAKIDSFVASGKHHYIVTPYSEMIVFSQSNPRYLSVLNTASLALPDGIGILWAAKFLSLPGNWLTSIFQIVYSGAAIVFNKKYVQTIIKEQITGSRFIFDIAKLASERNYSLALVGGENNVAGLAAEQLKKSFPNLRINLALSDREFGDVLATEVSGSLSDILLIAYSPPKQELWIAENVEIAKVTIGLGGTFDYLAGKRVVAPNFMHLMGLEWLWRLITQPWRIKRIWNAIPVFIWKVYKYKINHVRN